MCHAIVTPGFERKDERGVFREVLKDFSARTLITGRMKAGAVLGNHYHRRTRVFLYLTRGSARVRTVHVETGQTDAFSLVENQGVFLETNESHAVEFTQESDYVMLKSLPYEQSDPDTYPLVVERDTSRADPASVDR